QPVGAGGDAGHQVGGDPVAADLDRPDLGVAVHRVQVGVVAGEDVGELDPAADGQAGDGHVLGRAGRHDCLAAGGGDHRVGGVAEQAAPDGDAADVIAGLDGPVVLEGAGGRIRPGDEGAAQEHAGNPVLGIHVTRIR